MKSNILTVLKTKFVFVVTAFLLIMTTACQQTGEEDRIQLFNGKNLSGWNMKFSGYPVNENYNNTFRVEDSILTVSYDEWDRFDGEFGHLITEDTYSHYKLHVEYRTVGEQCPGGPEWARKNNGIMIHSQSAESMNRDQDFPVSVEVQLLSDLGEGSRPTANVCTPGTHVVMDGELTTQHCTQSSSKTYGDEWVTVEVVVKGDQVIHHIVEGDTVMTYTDPQIGGGNVPEGYPREEGTPLESGHISIQAESHPTEFREISLIELSDN
ncbi:MAG: 3-keto-disaccharide hydrolase [Bacteroidota bacterium]